MSAKSANAGFQASPTRKRALLDHLDNRLFQSLDSFSHVLYFVRTALQSGFPRRMCVVGPAGSSSLSVQQLHGDYS